MNKIAIIFTMKTCPHCQDFKKMLNEAGLEYIERDVYEYEEEYEMFLEVTGNEFVPAFILIEDYESETPKTGLYAPDRDFDTIQNGLQIIKEFYER